MEDPGGGDWRYAYTRARTNNADLQNHDVNILPDHENDKDDLIGTPNDIPNPPDNIHTEYDSEKKKTLVTKTSLIYSVMTLPPWKI